MTPAWDNLDDFLDTDDFATVATFTSQAGATKQVKGIFDEPYLDAQLGEYNMDASSPRFTCKAGDAAGTKRNDTCAIGGNQYDVLSVQPDGTGMATVQLATQ